MLTIEKIIYPGKSLSRSNGKVILLDEGLPEEIVETRIISEKKNYVEAETTNIIKPSSHRVTPRCIHYKICSSYQYIDYPFQLKIKKEQIEEILSQTLKENLPEVIVNPSPSVWNYRNNLRLSIIEKDERFSLAYHVPGALNDFKEIEECFLASININSLLKSFIKIVEKNKINFIEEVSVKENSKRTEMLLGLYGKHVKNLNEIPRIMQGLIKQFPIKGITYINSKTSAKYFLWGDHFIEETISDAVFYISALSFFQVNTPILIKLLDDIKSAVKLTGKQIIADLYCGVGTFGIGLAQKASRVIGIESFKENVTLLELAIKKNKIRNFTVNKGLVEKQIEAFLKTHIDVLIVDPPRKGLTDDICASIAKSTVPLVAYVSCNPSTFARDLKILKNSYSLKSIAIYDFFPHTPHIELLAIFEKR